ncbi:restriction endonuclease [Corallococcus sp. CA041A]|uniref:EcoAI/FtnUII family type I restriction enzme subunit R n=1 Tax=Corallococcus sp. CA041A TaxID=2316727 RepID=UPI000EA0563D|nr:DEAD/DEAH box helicase family protein [Corallococcus sp. CA041A]RKH23794.1 restriction endonuclease [Corallococcus sp. CA041A]
MATLDKKTLSERDVCTKYVTPALVKAGWDLQDQVREEVTFTKGRVIVRGNLASRGKSKRADYLLSYKPNLPLAVIEVKKAHKNSVSAGMQQALEYAEMLDVPFVFSSNGDGFLMHDRTGHSVPPERELSLAEFPSPEELWQRYAAWKGIAPGKAPAVTQPYYADSTDKGPRYYQVNAVNRTIEAISQGHPRALLVMATGTGKTYTAFQIIWRLWKAGVKKRILFLADRNILVDQARINDFKPFGGVMTKIANRQVDTAYEVYLALYQALSGSDPSKDTFKQFPSDFFDLVIVDECHRGSAAENSEWRDILEYFSSATQIGLTATPKETADVSTTHYFGEPVYTYSLKQGIEDGFLAPYKVVRIDLDKDLVGWRPEKGKRDKHGREIEDRIYNQRDYDRTLVLEQRTQIVAHKVTEFLKASDRMAKTIVFCEDIDHAERMRRAIVNENPDLSAQNRRYVMQITGDNNEGKAELDNFIDPYSPYPVVVTTSKLLTTGVDAQTCKVVVLDQNIRSMTEFKQIIGRGTRIHEDQKKYFFTILDFRKATEHFADPEFDGQPLQVYSPGEEEPLVPPDQDQAEDEPSLDDEVHFPADDRDEGRVKYVVGDVPVYVLSERVQYYGNDGKLITESLKDFTRQAVRKEYASLDAFLKQWATADRKQAIIDELARHGVLFEQLEEVVGKDYSPFDLVLHVAFDQPPLTRKERAAKIRKQSYFNKYGEVARSVLEALLDKYADEGLDDLEELKLLRVHPLTQLGTPLEIVESFGGKEKYLAAVRELKEGLYKAS